MPIIQLNPSIPLDTPKGKGHAIFLIDYSMEHHLFWVVALDETGEIWTYANPHVRVQKNISLNRRLEKDTMMPAKKWIQKALPKSSKGKLHRELGVPEGKKIPESKLKRAAKSKSPKIRKQVALAKTLSKLGKK